MSDDLKAAATKSGLGLLFSNSPVVHLDAKTWLEMYTVTESIQPALVGETRVTSIHFCKRRGGVQHEFLIASVEADDPPVVSHMTIERFYDSHQDKFNPKSGGRNSTEANGCDMNANGSPAESSLPSLSRSSSSNSSSSGGRHALDTITIYRRLQRLQEDRPYSILASRHFSPEKPFSLEKLLVLTNTVTERIPQYHLIVSQCYWFAHSLWAAIELEYQFQDDGMQKPGKFLARDGAEPAALQKQFQVAWSKFEAKIRDRLEEERRKVQEAVGEAERQAEMRHREALDALVAENQRLQRLLEQRQDGVAV